MALLKRNFKISEKSKQSILLKMNQKIADVADAQMVQKPLTSLAGSMNIIFSCIE